MVLENHQPCYALPSAVAVSQECAMKLYNRVVSYVFDDTAVGDVPGRPEGRGGVN